jgi:GT2 family glycosyltransferase
METCCDIILVNYNSTDMLLRSIRSVFDIINDHNVKIIIQDNGSQDRVERLTVIYPRVFLTRNYANLGFAKAVNQGLNQGIAPYVVLLNPDAYVRRDFFTATLRFMAENRDVGILGPRILDPDGTIQDSARSFPNPFTGLFGRTALFSRWFPTNRLSRRNLLTRMSDGITPMEVDWVSGACMVVRRRAVEEVGPMDERFFLYWEDADWCRRMWRKDWKVVYFPGASVVHVARGSSDKVPRQALIEFHRSAYRLFAKYAEGSQRFAKPLVLWALALRLLLLLCWQRVRER